MIIYQVYMPTWKKISAVRDKIPHFKDMGYEMIWLTPFFPDGGSDGGYDVTDFYNVADKYGTLEELIELIDELHANNIKVMTELVLNHVSDKHEWFLQAKTSRENYFHDFFLWEDKQPNDWGSIFEPSAWQYVSEVSQFYFHAFTTQQVDLNWENPKVVEEVKKIIDFWIEKGVDAFRFDAITHLKKGAWNLPNDVDDCGKNYRCQEGLEKYLGQIKEMFVGHEDIFLMGEANGIDVWTAKDWIENKGFFDAVVQFCHLMPFKTEGGKIKGTTSEMIEIMEEWSEILRENNLSYVSNHDIALPTSILSIDPFSIADVLFMQKGHKIIFNGQEFGQKNKLWHSLDEFTEPETQNRYETLKKQGVKPIIAYALSMYLSRENARQPIPWGENYELKEHYKELIAKDKKERERYV